MTPDVITSLASHAMYITLLVASPLLASALVIGLVVSLFQAATQINEMTLSFIPKILGVFARLINRDGKKRYAEFFPRVERYFRNDLQHPDLAEVRRFFERHFPEILR